MALKKNKYFLLIGLVILLVSCVVVVMPGTPASPVVLKEPMPLTATVSGMTTDVLEITTTIFPVYFTNPMRPYDGRKTGGIEDNLIVLIDNAKTSVDLAVFEFDLEDVAAALIRAKTRGVEVRVVHDNEYTAPDPQIGELEKAGIPTVPDNRSAFMHNKFFVIDDYCVWTGSFNLSVNAAYKNNENAVVICDAKLAKNYTTEFQEMFAGEFGPKSPADTPYPSLVVNGVQIENYFAPEDHVMTKVVEAVAKSKTSVHFMAFSFTDKDLAKAMIDLMNDGVEVAGIFESRGANTSSSVCLTLLTNHALIGLDGNPYTFHHKVIIIDHKIVIFGSFNFSANADVQNDENLLIMYSENLAAHFEQEFDTRMAESVAPQNGECSHK